MDRYVVRGSFIVTHPYCIMQRGETVEPTKSHVEYLTKVAYMLQLWLSYVNINRGRTLNTTHLAEERHCKLYIKSQGLYFNT